MDYFDFSNELTDNDNKKFSGMSLNIPDFSLYKDDFFPLEITMECQYRPDIIAYEFYNNGDLSWVVDEINNFNKLSSYELGTKINLLPYNILIDLGIE